MSVAWQHNVFPANDAAACPASIRWLRRVGLRCHISSPVGTARIWSTVVVMFLALAVSSGMSAESESESQAPTTIPRKVWRYAQRWVVRHDTDEDGQLTEAEWPNEDSHLDAADANRDAIVTIDELAEHIADFGVHRKIRLMPAGGGGVVPLPSLLPPTVAGGLQQAAFPGANADGFAGETERQADDLDEDEPPDDDNQRKYYVPPSRMPPGLPDWFRKADRNGDGQLTFAEYAELGSPSADKEFAKHDRNRDGLMTPGEVVGGSNRVQRTPKPAPVSEEKVSPEVVPEEQAAPASATVEESHTEEKLNTVAETPSEVRSPEEDHDREQIPKKRSRSR